MSNVVKLGLLLALFVIPDIAAASGGTPSRFFGNAITLLQGEIPWIGYLLSLLALIVGGLLMLGGRALQGFMCFVVALLFWIGPSVLQSMLTATVPVG